MIKYIKISDRKKVFSGEWIIQEKFNIVFIMRKN